jgi:hypothetical protein
LRKQVASQLLMMERKWWPPALCYLQHTFLSQWYIWKYKTKNECHHLHLCTQLCLLETVGPTLNNSLNTVSLILIYKIL